MLKEAYQEQTYLCHCAEIPLSYEKPILRPVLPYKRDSA